MEERTMYTITVAFILLYVSAFVIMYLTIRDQENVFQMGLYALSSLITITTMILAIMFLRPSTKEMYEKWLQEDEKR